MVIFGDTEVHTVLGKPAGTFVNTGEPDGNQFFSATAAPTEIDKPDGFTFGRAEFWLESPEGEIHVATEGQDPHGIIVPGDWKWPVEYLPITEAYPEFSLYFIEGGVNEDYADWYKHPAEGKVYQE